VSSLVPIPGLSSVAGVVKSIIRSTTTYIDETIFSYNLARADDNPYRSAKDGIIYYAQNSKEILKTAIGVVILDKVVTFLIWLLMLAPAALLAHALPAFVLGGGWFLILMVALLLAGTIRAAFVKPIFLIMIMTKFHVSAHRQPINEQWDAKLSILSGKFKTLKEKITSYRIGEDQIETVKPNAAA
jgi:hypothetical protein